MCLIFSLILSRTDLEFNIYNSKLRCVLLCASYSFYQEIEMKNCFFYEGDHFFFFFLICIKISANLFFFFPPGDFVLLLHLSFKSLSCKSKCKHFYIYKHFVALIKTRLFQLYATTCHSTWKAKLISALYLVMSQSLL